jgi:hypothetical protein
MRTLLRDVIQHSALLLTLILTPALLSSQTTQAPSATPLPEDNIPPTEFTTIMKEAWSFLKDETDAYTKTVGKKTEFETTAEFEKRSIEARQQYLTKITKYMKDKKFDQRVIGVLLKAKLDKYDADNQIYSVSCPVDIEAPYNLPSVSTEVPVNNYVGLADSIKKGYRTSSIRLKFNPYFRWQVARDIAMTTKNDEADVTFKIRFKIELTGQGESGKGARFVVVPKQVMLMNQKTNTIYWEQTLR